MVYSFFCILIGWGQVHASKVFNYYYLVTFGSFSNKHITYLDKKTQKKTYSNKFCLWTWKLWLIVNPQKYSLIKCMAHTRLLYCLARNHFREGNKSRSFKKKKKNSNTKKKFQRIIINFNDIRTSHSKIVLRIYITSYANKYIHIIIEKTFWKKAEKITDFLPPFPLFQCWTDEHWVSNFFNIGKWDFLMKFLKCPEQFSSWLALCYCFLRRWFHVSFLFS